MIEVKITDLYTGTIETKRTPPTGGTPRHIIFDGTTGTKSAGTAQIVDFRSFSGGANIVIVKPRQLGGSYGIVFQ